jgi:hypothetical protein
MGEIFTSGSETYHVLKAVKCRDETELTPMVNKHLMQITYEGITIITKIQTKDNRLSHNLKP